MYLKKLEGSKTPVKLAMDLGYRVIAHIIEVQHLGIVFDIIESDNSDYPVGKKAFVSNVADCSFIEV
jgi:hypothetical protein